MNENPERITGLKKASTEFFTVHSQIRRGIQYVGTRLSSIKTAGESTSSCNGLTFSIFLPADLRAGSRPFPREGGKLELR
jgi:hypothetical protein